MAKAQDVKLFLCVRWLDLGKGNKGRDHKNEYPTARFRNWYEGHFGRSRYMKIHEYMWRVRASPTLECKGTHSAMERTNYTV